jgi:2-keto-3-deoxy-L-arabinonate dehydratase
MRHTLDLSMSHVARRVPVIVTCSYFSVRIAAERGRRAAKAGAAMLMLMLMPPYHGALLKAGEAGMLAHFAQVADAARIPLMLQDAPLSGISLSVPFIVRLANEVPLRQYFKIETPGTAAELRALIATGGKSIVGPFDGEEGITMMADLDAGATGTMMSAMISDLIKPILIAHQAGRRSEAVLIYDRVLPAINYENLQCGLRGCKTVMMEGGVFKSDTVRHPLEALHPQTRAGLLEIVRPLNPIALRWGK